MKRRLGIYIHIPFCVRKCEYCDFLSAPAGEETREQYAAMLKKEIAEAEDLAGRFQAETVFFGGGTPSLLSAEEFSGIMDALYRRFDVLPDAEITVECNPGTLTKEKLSAYKAAGVSRLSIGLQSADDRELKMLGRIHTWKEFQESYDLARSAGFDNLNIDLISALPGQTESAWMNTLSRTAALEPEHISAYSLIIEEGTPFYRQYAEGGPLENLLPDEDTERKMYEDTKLFLQERGYERYEISNYARPGYACRHNLSYWERIDYKGFGIGAASLVDEVRYKNSASLAAYLRGDFSFESREELRKKDRLEETMFLGLRKMEGVALTEELWSVYGRTFEDLKKKGLLKEEKGRILLTDRGIDISNYVLSEFLLDEEKD